jgi:hypothetical protein
MPAVGDAMVKSMTRTCILRRVYHPEQINYLELTFPPIEFLSSLN